MKNQFCKIFIRQHFSYQQTYKQSDIINLKQPNIKSKQLLSSIKSNPDSKQLIYTSLLPSSHFNLPVTFKPFFDYVSKDSLIFYPYVTECIQLGTKKIKQKSDHILAQKLPKELKKLRLQQLRKDTLFIEVQNLIQQLGEINETMLYLFCSMQHCRYMKFEIPSNFFLSTNNTRLEDIHMIMNEIQKVEKKNQRLKKYISLMVQKLDQSVNKVVKRDKARNSYYEMMGEQKCEQSCDPTYEEEECVKELGRKNGQKKFLFFEDVTQNI